MNRHTSRSLLVALVSSLALTTAACAGHDVEPEADENVASTAGSISFEEFLANHVFRDAHGVYIYDGDMTATSMEELEEAYRKMYLDDSALVVNQAFWTDDIWHYPESHNLTYCVSDSFGARKQRVVEALQAATAAWEEYINVNFIHLPQYDSDCHSLNTMVIFDVNPGWLAGFAGRAFSPSDPRPFRNLLLDDVAFTESDSDFKGTLMHELGHALGFRHEHIRPESGCTFEGWGWRTVTAYDQASIMHYQSCGGTNYSTLSTFDKEGAALLYGARKLSDWPTPIYGCGILGSENDLRPGEWIPSCDYRFWFGLQHDGNVVLYQGDTPLWSSETWDQPAYSLRMQHDGNLVLYTGLPRVLWASNTNGPPGGAHLAVQNDGNVVIYRNGVPLWSTGTCCR